MGSVVAMTTAHAACGDATPRPTQFGEPGGDASAAEAGSSGAPGFSSSSGDAALPACATATATAQRLPLYLDIVLDGSRSMDGYTNTATDQNHETLCESGTYPWPPTGPGTCMLANSRESDPLSNPAGRRTGKKWLAARGALKAFFDARAAAPDPNVGVGMLLFSSTASAKEPVALLDGAHAAALWGLIKPETWPDLGTPLEASIESQAAELRAFDPGSTLAPNGRRVILLITDGVPDEMPLRPGVRDAVSDALAGTPSVATAVIGVGNPGDNPDTVYDAKFLSALAKLGGASAPGCDPEWTESSGTTSCHLQVTPGQLGADALQAQFSAALEQIALSLSSCELALDQTAAIDPDKVNVVYVDPNGAASQVPKDEQNGWSYDDPEQPSVVRLHGAACDAFKGAAGGKVDIVVGCPTGTEVVN